jgi:hypothetical protein
MRGHEATRQWRARGSGFVQTMKKSKVRSERERSGVEYWEGVGEKRTVTVAEW